MSQFSTTQYEPLTSLASDGELEAWLACATEPDGRRHLVLIERIPRAVSDDGALLRAAFQETQRAATLTHQSLATARDLFERDDGYYVALDFVRGEPIDFVWRSFAGQGQDIPLALTARVIAEAAAALDFARRRTSSAGHPLIHGHLTPRSLLLGYDGRTKLIGHGTAAIHRGVARARGGLGGSNLQYCAPEQFKGGEPDARTDMFALGVILWELLCGQRLFDRSGPYEVMRAVCEEDVPRPSIVNGAVPSRLDPIVQRALAKRPERRFADYGEFLGALEGILQLPNVADQSMRLGAMLSRRFASRASRWREVDEAERAGDFRRAAYLVRELEQETTRTPTSTGQVGEATVTDVILGDTTSQDATQPRSALQADDEPTQVHAAGPLDDGDPEDTLLTQVPDEIWAEATATNELEPRSTMMGGRPGGASQDDERATAEMDARLDVSGESILLDDPTQAFRTKEPKKPRHGTEVGLPLSSGDPTVDQDVTQPRPAPERQPEPEPRAPFLGGFSEAEEVDEPTESVVREPKPSAQAQPAQTDHRDATPGSQEPVDPPRDEARQPVHPSVSLGPGFDDLDWSEAFGQFDEDDDDGDEEFESPFDLDEILDAPQTRLPSRDDRDQHLVMEIVRYVDGRALAIETLQGWKRRYREKSAPFTAKLGRQGGTITLRDSVDGWVRRKNDGDTRRDLPADGPIALRSGDQCELRKGGLRYRIRVFRPPLAPMRNSRQFTRERVVIYALALAVALVAHGAALLGVLGIEAVGVRMTIDQKPKQDEIFAEGKLDKIKKPEKKPPKPKPTKPLPPTRPTPKPADPAEQKVKIPKSIKDWLAKRVHDKVRSHSHGPAGNASDTSKVLEMLKSPNPGEGTSVKEVVSNIDAVKKPHGSSGGFKIGGTIASLKGNKVNMALGGGGELGKLGGKRIGKKVGKLSKRKHTSGHVRGKVSSIHALTKVQGSLSRSDVFKAINRYMGRIQGCYETRLLDKPSLSGKVVFTWTIKTNGRVRSARQRSSTLGDAKVSNCVLHVIKKMKFPHPKGGEVEIAYPFIFQQR